MIDLTLYKNIIFDFDGVVVDSNFIKEKCIFKASEDYAQKEYHQKFIEYFIQNNGIPREIKIDNFFSKDNSTQILENYNNCLSKQLENVDLTKGFEAFLSLLRFYKKNLFILSGGTQAEVLQILKSKNIENEFVKVMGGPKTKEENLDESYLVGKSLFIGDSLKDYKVAVKYGFDFIFMYGYTQFENWKEFFRDKDILLSIKDFSILTNCKC